MLRAFVYIVLGWLLIALVGGMAEVLDVTVMLPATSAVIVTHVAFSRSASVPAPLCVAVALGYLEDLHQGAPIGTLTMAYAVTYLALRWVSARLALTGWVLQGLVALATVVFVDLVTFGVLIAMADAFGVRREALVTSLFSVHWHALATLLVAPPVWSLIDRTMARLKLDERPPGQAYWTGQ
ncbi:MAG: hypothetical protein JKY37_13335 [Nannocystaceae bacterium]|nr:hypothetical protein [Nannocystaceae bacterium]